MLFLVGLWLQAESGLAIGSEVRQMHPPAPPPSDRVHYSKTSVADSWGMGGDGRGSDWFALSFCRDYRNLTAVSQNFFYWCEVTL